MLTHLNCSKKGRRQRGGNRIGGTCVCFCVPVWAKQFMLVVQNVKHVNQKSFACRSLRTTGRMNCFRRASLRAFRTRTSRLSPIEMHMYKLQRLCHQLWQQHQHVNCMTILVRRLAGCSNGGNPLCVRISTELLIRHWQHCFINCDTHSASISVR